MSKKDKITLFILCLLTSVLLSCVLSFFTIKYVYGNKIVEIHKSVTTIETTLIK